MSQFLRLMCCIHISLKSDYLHLTLQKRRKEVSHWLIIIIIINSYIMNSEQFYVSCGFSIFTPTGPTFIYTDLTCDTVNVLNAHVQLNKPYENGNAASAS